MEYGYQEREKIRELSRQDLVSFAWSSREKQRSYERRRSQEKYVYKKYLEAKTAWMNSGDYIKNEYVTEHAVFIEICKNAKKLLERLECIPDHLSVKLYQSDSKDWKLISRAYYLRKDMRMLLYACNRKPGQYTSEDIRILDDLIDMDEYKTMKYEITISNQEPRNYLI